MEELGIGPIDLLAVNLYPFRETIARGADWETCIENIDIGGPAMIRAAAKNHSSVIVLTDPDDYEEVLQEIRETNGGVSGATRRRLAAKAFATTAAYDAAIAAWMSGEGTQRLQSSLTLMAERIQELRYGKIPSKKPPSIASAPPTRRGHRTAASGQGLSYNNLNDTDAAFEAVAEFERPAAVIVKHANPCGVAEADQLAEAYRLARACDRSVPMGESSRSIGRSTAQRPSS